MHGIIVIIMYPWFQATVGCLRTSRLWVSAHRCEMSTSTWRDLCSMQFFGCMIICLLVQSFTSALLSSNNTIMAGLPVM